MFIFKNMSAKYPSLYNHSLVVILLNVWWKNWSNLQLSLHESFSSKQLSYFRMQQKCFMVLLNLSCTILKDRSQESRFNEADYFHCIIKDIFPPPEKNYFTIFNWNAVDLQCSVSFSVHQSDSLTHIFFFRCFSHIDYYKILSMVPCAIQYIFVGYLFYVWKKVKVNIAQSISDSLRRHGLYSPWTSPGQNTGVNSLSLLQGIFPTQGSNAGLLNCRRILYQLGYQGSLFYV